MILILVRNCTKAQSVSRALPSLSTRPTPEEASGKVERALEHSILRLRAEDGLLSRVEQSAILDAERRSQCEQLLSPERRQDLSAELVCKHSLSGAGAGEEDGAYRPTS